MPKHILTVANLPCSAGTFQTHYIARTLSESAWITGETNPYSMRDPQVFIPEDPLHVIRTTRTMGEQEWIEEYRRRISRLIDLFLEDPVASVLIIRDHSLGECWRFLGKSIGAVAPALAEAIEAREVPFTAFYTHRDPFDTFLSLRRSFPGIAKVDDLKTPDRFSRLYLHSWQTWKSHCPQLQNVCIEELATDEQSVQKRIRSVVFGQEERLACQAAPIAITREEMASGASGRRHPRPMKMPRHPCTSALFSSAMNSQPLQELRNLIGYHQPITMDRRTRLSCLKQDLKAQVRKVWR
jgi:hypothetical protein